MSKFITYTVGLDVATNQGAKLLKVEVAQNEDGNIEITAVSGHNLATVSRTITITAEKWDRRPDDSVECAIWALQKLGL